MATTKQILRCISTVEARTANAIAKKLGLNKATKSLNTAIQELIEEGSVIADNSGRYTTYTKAGSSSVSKKSTTEAVTTSITKEASAVVETELPEANVDGFKIKNVKFKGKMVKKITTPDGKHVRLNEGERLLIINNKPEFVVKSADEVIKAIRKYSTDKGLSTFTVNDLKQNAKITGEKDIKISDNHLLFMEIKKHNKAA